MASQPVGPTNAPRRCSRTAAAVLGLTAAVWLLLPTAGAAQAAGQGSAQAAGQGRAGGPYPDTLRLDDLHAAVRGVDPRSGAISLHRRATRARLEGLDGRWLPHLRLAGEATHQTETPTALSAEDAAVLPAGLSIPRPPEDRYEVALEVEQTLWDGGRTSGLRSLERAAGAERVAGTRASLYDLRAEVDAAFFSALEQQQRAGQLGLLLQDLEARRRTVAARVRAGSQLPAELAAVEAEQVRARQRLDAAEAGRRAALDRLGLLLDREVDPGTVLSVPDLGAASRELASELDRDVLRGSGGADTVPDGRARFPWRHRPEWRRLRRTETRLRAQADVADAEDRPLLSAFVRGAVGRPGLDFFDDAASAYAVLGVRMSWSLFDGGDAGSRERAFRLRARATRAERKALGRSLRRRAGSVLPEGDRLRRALDTDDRLVRLQERRRRTALRQLEEGVLLPSEYVDRRTDVFEARLRRRLHRVLLAQTRARLLRILGRPLPDAGGPDGLRIPVPLPSDETGAER